VERKIGYFTRTTQGKLLFRDRRGSDEMAIISK